MKLLKALALTLALAAGAALVWIGGTAAWAARRESRALSAWSALGLPLSDASPFPKKDSNAAARSLEKDAHAIGIALQPRTGAAPTQPEPPGMDREAKTEWSRTRVALTKWTTDEAERPESNVRPPPPEVAAWLTGNAAALDAIESALVTGPAPEWAEDAGLLFAAPAPSISGHLQLHTAVLARALARAAAGDASAAERALLASWNLAAPERRRADVPSRAIASLATHLELGVLRKLSVPPEPWRARIAAWNPRESVERTWMQEAWTTWQASRRRTSGVPASFGLATAGPARRLEAAAFLDGWRSMTEAGRRSPVSDGDGSEIAAAFRSGMGRWADAAPPVPNLASAWKRADRLLLEAELTSKVFDVRAAREATGAWAAAIKGIETSTAKDVKWTYAVTPEGRASLSTNRTLTWPDRASSPLGWVSKPAGE